MEIPEALAPELLVFGRVVLRGLVAAASVARWLRGARRAPHRFLEAHDRMRTELEPPGASGPPRSDFSGDFPGRTMWGPTLCA